MNRDAQISQVEIIVIRHFVLFSVLQYHGVFCGIPHREPRGRSGFEALFHELNKSGDVFEGYFVNYIIDI